MGSGFIEALANIVGPKSILIGDDVRQRSVVWSGHVACEAAMLVRPGTPEEVAAVVRLLAAEKQPMVVHGGLTGLVGGAHATSDEVVISLERLTDIEEVNVVNRTMTVQAGVPIQAIQETAREHGLSFQLDFGARGSATIGGAISTNAGGNRVLRFGTARDQVLGLEVVTADGDRVSAMSGLIKDNSGYDIKHLFIGSEGTLGIVTRAVLRLRSAPQSSSTALVGCEGFSQVLGLLATLDSALGGQLSAFELMWPEFYRAVTSPPAKGRSPLPGEHAYYVLIEAEGGNEEADREWFMTVLANAIEAGNADDAVIAKSAAEREALWALRDDIDAIFKRGAYISYDVSLPRSEMEEYVERIRRDLAREFPAVEILLFGHIGDGNIHLVTISQTAYSPEDKRAINEIVYAPLGPIHGSVSAEHGIGLDKRTYLPLSRSAAEIKIMQTLKRALDPLGLLNRGKVI
jgi:FAD/FMN-containing dehydrogenase